MFQKKWRSFTITCLYLNPECGLSTSGLDEFVKRLKKIGQIEIIPVDELIWIKNIELEWDHRDPADRV